MILEQILGHLLEYLFQGLAFIAIALLAIPRLVIRKKDKPDDRLNKTEGSEDADILNYYKDGNFVRPGDLDKVEELASIGLIRMGVSFREYEETAITTELGLRFI